MSKGQVDAVPGVDGADAPPPAGTPAETASQEGAFLILTKAQQHAGCVWEEVRPWATFFKLRRPDLSMVKVNLQYFRANYTLFFAFWLFVGIVQHTSYVFVMGLVVCGWAAFVAKDMADPDWHPRLAGMELSPSHRWALLAVSSLTILLVVAGELLFTVIGFTTVLSVCHAAAHPGAVEECPATGPEATNSSVPVVIGAPLAMEDPEWGSQMVVGRPVYPTAVVAPPAAAPAPDCGSSSSAAAAEMPPPVFGGGGPWERR